MTLNIGSVCKGGGSWENHTGTWRYFRPVISDDCTGCGICEKYCPEGTVEVQNDVAKINYNYCKGCGICKNECPVNAVDMIEEQSKS